MCMSFIVALVWCFVGHTETTQLIFLIADFGASNYSEKKKLLLKNNKKGEREKITKISSYYLAPENKYSFD